MGLPRLSPAPGVTRSPSGYETQQFRGAVAPRNDRLPGILAAAGNLRKRGEGREEGLIERSARAVARKTDA